jgi:hypothetical protein
VEYSESMGLADGHGCCGDRVKIATPMLEPHPHMAGVGDQRVLVAPRIQQPICKETASCILERAFVTAP